MTDLKSISSDLKNDNILIHSLLGTGKFGNVYHITYKLENKNINAALKVIKVKDINEISSLVELSKYPKCNNYILCIYDYIEKNGKVYIITEILKGTDLGILKTDKLELSNFDILIFMKKLLEGLSFIHSKNITHRDIKLENIILTNSKLLKYIDFGFSCKIDKCSKGMVGTPYYMPPEMIERKITDYKKVDIYALGVVFYFFVHKQFPYQGKNMKELEKNILTTTVLCKSTNDDVNTIINNMLSKNSNDRMNPESLLKLL